MDNNQNMPGQENDKREEKEYSLYTEKIVKRPGNRIKRAVKHVAKVIGSAVIFGVVSGLVLSVVYPTAKKFVGDDETVTRQGPVIPTDSQTEENTDYSESYVESDIQEPENDAESGTDNTKESGYSDNTAEVITDSDTQAASDDVESDDEHKASVEYEEFMSLVDEQIAYAFDIYKPGIAEFDSMYTSLKSVIADASKSIVSIEVSQDDIWDYVPDTGIMGIIAAEDDEYFYILTIKQLVDNKNIFIIFNDGTSADGTYIAGDTTTNLAIIAVEKSVYGETIPESVKAAVLGNSYVVQQGDPIIAMGCLHGQSGMAAYTMAASVKENLVDTDSNYRLISTDIEADENDCGIIINMKGEVVGIIPYNNEAFSGKIINSYGISELKRLIERLINGKVTPYAGIAPQTVTAEMKNIYGMPDGVYVNTVENDSPAFYAGIQSGDIITAMGSESVQTVRAFQNALFLTEPGTNITVYISRPGNDGYRDIEISLEAGVE